MAIAASLAQRLIALSVVGASLACSRVEPRREAALPPVDGQLTVEGIAAEVTVTRDAWGIPHIRAANASDLFFAQGFVQAQDRLFQMDLWRRSALGRLAEVLGPNFIERDAMTRRIQYHGDRREEWAAYGDDAQAIALAFTRGINAWVARARQDLPEEFRLAGWVPEFWRPEDLLARTDAFVTGGNAREEVFRAQLGAAVGRSRLRELFRSPASQAADAAAPDLSTISPVVSEILLRIGAPPLFSGFAASFSEASGGRAGGSNAWAVERRAGAGPWVAVDPHRALQTPSLRYLVHLHAPGWHVAGATAPWLPGVAIGHNERIAWGMTAASLDTQDIYVEELNPSDHRQVRSAGGWVNLSVRTDAIGVKGRSEPYEYEQLFTPRGVVVALDRERHRAYAIRWTGTEPGTAAEAAAPALARAASWQEFRAALVRWRMPVAEFVYADRDGIVRRQTAGLVPRRIDASGLLPARGDLRAGSWEAWHTLDTLPHEPARGGVVAAANGSRARLERIDEALSAGHARADEEPMARVAALQLDVVSVRARRLVPLLRRAPLAGTDLERARARLLAWDRHVTVDSADAALYVEWERALVRQLADRAVPKDLSAEYARRAEPVLIEAIERSARPWFRSASERDRLLAEALAAVVSRLSGEPAAARGSLNRVTFAHPLAISDAARARFNVGPFAMPGYGATVLAVEASPERSIGPAFRAVFDVGDWDRSIVVNAPGQSERPASPHFADFAQAWAEGQSVPLAFSDQAVRRHSRATLTLVPAVR
jgi:penicillin amidase